MLERVKLALRLSTEDFDSELLDLIQASLSDLGVAGVVLPDDASDPLIVDAVICYCKLNFGTINDNTAYRLKKAYDEKKAQLVTATGYTNWGN